MSALLSRSSSSSSSRCCTAGVGPSCRLVQARSLLQRPSGHLRTCKGHSVVARAKKEDEDAGVELPAFDAELAVLEAQAKLAEVSGEVAVKGPLIVVSVGGLALLWVSISVALAFDSVPALGKALELVGVGYTAFFANKYLLFKPGREELKNDIALLRDSLGI